MIALTMLLVLRITMRAKAVIHTHDLGIVAYRTIRITRLAFLMPSQFPAASFAFDDGYCPAHPFFLPLPLLIQQIATNVTQIIAVIIIAFMIVPLAMPL